jgi:hypothetical protein
MIAPSGKIRVPEVVIVDMTQNVQKPEGCLSMICSYFRRTHDVSEKWQVSASEDVRNILGQAVNGLLNGELKTTVAKKKPSSGPSLPTLPPNLGKYLEKRGYVNLLFQTEANSGDANPNARTRVAYACMSADLSLQRVCAAKGKRYCINEELLMSEAGSHGRLVLIQFQRKQDKSHESSSTDLALLAGSESLQGSSTTDDVSEWTLKKFQAPPALVSYLSRETQELFYDDNAVFTTAGLWWLHSILVQDGYALINMESSSDRTNMEFMYILSEKLTSCGESQVSSASLPSTVPWTVTPSAPLPSAVAQQALAFAPPHL